MSKSSKGLAWVEKAYDSISRVGYLTAVTLISEIGDINGFIGLL